jgi:hypothetical protein
MFRLGAMDLFESSMSLGAGEKLGPYEIVAPIGAGGMALRIGESAEAGVSTILWSLVLFRRMAGQNPVSLQASFSGRQVGGPLFPVHFAQIRAHQVPLNVGDADCQSHFWVPVLRQAISQINFGTH